MPIPSSYFDRTVHLSESREQRIAQVNLDINYGDGALVRKTRDEIAYMGPLDTVLDLFEGGEKKRTLELLATKLLCQNALAWQDRNPSEVPAEELGMAKLLVTQQELFPLLTAHGLWEASSTDFEEVPNGMRSKPATNNALKSELLSFYCSYEYAGDRLNEMSQYADAAAAYAKAAHREALAGRPEEASSFLIKEGTCWWRANRDDLAAETFERAAEALAEVTADVKCSLVPRLTAKACMDEAQAWQYAEARWEAAGQPERAAQAAANAARALGEAGENWSAASDHYNAAHTARREEAAWLAAGQPTQARQAEAKEAEAWEARDAPLDAARAWSRLAMSLEFDGQAGHAVSARIREADALTRAARFKEAEAVYEEAAKALNTEEKFEELVRIQAKAERARNAAGIALSRPLGPGILASKVVGDGRVEARNRDAGRLSFGGNDAGSGDEGNLANAGDDDEGDLAGSGEM